MKNDTPIISSLMDTDFYKFTMGQLIFEHFRDVNVTTGFTNRTLDVSILDYVSLEEIREQLEYVRQLCFTESELEYLRGLDNNGQPMFCEEYLQALADLELSDYRLEVVDGRLKLEFFGTWHGVTYWEIYALAIVNELYFRKQLEKLSLVEQNKVYTEGKYRLQLKINKLRQYPELKFVDFGTRRRFSRAWQRYVVEAMALILPNQLIGTSNVKLAQELGLVPMGTSAHEPEMVLAGLAGNDDGLLLKSHRRYLNLWWKMYGWGLSIALSDTFGSEFFFRDFADVANGWKGVRQDSGDPFEFGERTIKFYQDLGIDPKDKMIIFSDGLDVDKMIQLFERFHNRIKVSFGWGTNLTNDLGFRALSLVVKAIKANDQPLVKLSDNLAKAIGPKKEIERYTRVFGYHNNYNQKCVY